jgi:hypothetical protein
MPRANADGRLVPPTEVLHGQPVLLEPGQFAETHPVSRTMLAAAIAQLRTEVDSDTRPPASLFVVPVRPGPDGTTPLAAACVLRRVDDLHAAKHGFSSFAAASSTA